MLSSPALKIMPMKQSGGLSHLKTLPPLPRLDFPNYLSEQDALNSIMFLARRTTKN